MDIFSTQRGRVAAMDSPGIPMSLFVEDWGGFHGFKSIITQIKVQQQGGVQFMHTLRDFIYIYVFGERIGQMTISGLSFFISCDGSDCHGLEFVNQYYLNNRVSERASPIAIVLGCGTPFFGFLVGMTLDLNNPEDLIGSFNLDLRVIPEAATLGDVSGDLITNAFSGTGNAIAGTVEETRGSAIEDVGAGQTNIA